MPEREESSVMVAVFGWKLKSINIVELTQHWLWNPTCVGIGLSSTQEREKHLEATSHLS